MSTATKTRTPSRPPIAIIATDHERLSALASAAMGRMPDVASYLSEELDRARIVPPAGRKAQDVVTMGSEVEFRDEDTGRVQRFILVYPEEADVAQRKISVLTPIGAALIGLTEGQTISWTARDGEERRLTVCKIEKPASEQPA